MKGNAGRGKRIAAITAAILTFTGVATVNPYMVYAQDAAKSITITGNTTEILKGSSDAKNQQNHWSMQIDNETGKDILFYDLKEDNKEITKKQAFKGDTLVLDLENYDGNSVYTVEVYGVDKNIKASVKLYQVQANLTGDTSTNVPMANGVVSEAEKSRTYEASESCVVNDVDYDLNGNGNVSVGYDDNKSSSGYSVDYVKHDSTKNSNIYKAGVQLTDDSGNVLSSENITYYGTYTYQAPKTFSQTSTDENGKSIVNYYKAVDEKAQAVLKKEDNGKSIKIAYQKVDSQTAYDWNINLIDLMTGKTLKTVAAFTNRVRYGSITFTGNKTLNDKPSAEAFRYTVVEKSADGGIVEDGYKSGGIKNDANGAIQFPAISYTKAGIHYYDVREINDSADTTGIAYDNTVYTVVVVVEDDNSESGTGLTTNAVYYKDFDYKTKTGTKVENNSITFANNMSASVSLEGMKTLDGKKVSKAGEYSFDIVETNASGDALEGEAPQSVSNDNTGKFTFPAYTYTDEGTHYYKITPWWI